MSMHGHDHGDGHGNGHSDPGVEKRSHINSKITALQKPSSSVYFQRNIACGSIFAFISFDLLFKTTVYTKQTTKQDMQHYTWRRDCPKTSDPQ